MSQPNQDKTLRLEDLSPAARQAIETKAITGGWDVRSLRKLLAELHRWDNMAEARKSRADKLFIACLIATFVGFFLLIVVGVMAENLLVGVPLFVVPLIGVFVTNKMKKAARAIDLPNELRVCLRPLLQQLSQDLNPQEKIKVALDLNGPCEKTRTCNMQPDTRRSNRKITSYSLPLGTLRLPLIDGSEAVLRFENTVHEFSISKRNSRGKTKSKTKWKKECAVSATLIPPTRIDWESGKVHATIDRNCERMSFAEKDGVMVARIERYYKFKSDKEPGDVAPPGDVMGMLVRLISMRPPAAGGAR